MFQDTAGTVPVTTVGQSVALVRDKSGNGQDITQSNVSNRPTLQNDGTSYYLQFTAASSQWLERANSNNLYPGTQSMIGLVANTGTSSASTAYSRALAGPGTNRYTIGYASSKGDSGAYEWPSSNNDAQTSATVSFNTKNILSQTIDRAIGVNKVWWKPTGGAHLKGTSEVTVGTTNMTSAYRFRVGAYGNSSDSGAQSFWDGKIYGLIVVFQSTLDYAARDSAETWMINKYGF